MSEDQRLRMVERFDARRRAAPVDSLDRALCKIIIMMLGYSASVHAIAKRSRQFHARYGATT